MGVGIDGRWSGLDHWVLMREEKGFRHAKLHSDSGYVWRGVGVSTRIIGVRAKIIGLTHSGSLFRRHEPAERLGKWRRAGPDQRALCVVLMVLREKGPVSPIVIQEAS
jgi:hypothetical protein